jgi:hypothetical protein
MSRATLPPESALPRVLACACAEEERPDVPFVELQDAVASAHAHIRDIHAAARECERSGDIGFALEAYRVVRVGQTFTAAASRTIRVGLGIELCPCPNCERRRRYVS